MQPNKEVVKLWITALRSGLYAQCHGKKFDRGRYCAMGVLEEVAYEVGVAGLAKRSSNGVFADAEGGYVAKDVLDAAWVQAPVLAWAGVDQWGTYGPAGDDAVSTLNDVHRLGFKAIASVLERRLVHAQPEVVA